MKKILSLFFTCIYERIREDASIRLRDTLYRCNPRERETTYQPSVVGAQTNFDVGQSLALEVFQIFCVCWAMMMMLYSGNASAVLRHSCAVRSAVHA